jgi:hypothetical protein
MTEQLLEEPDGGLRLGREQFGPGERAGLVVPPAAGVGSGLPDAGGTAARWLHKHHGSGVPDVLRSEAH